MGFLFCFFFLLEKGVSIISFGKFFEVKKVTS